MAVARYRGDDAPIADEDSRRCGAATSPARLGSSREVDDRNAARPLLFSSLMMTIDSAELDTVRGGFSFRAMGPYLLQGLITGGAQGLMSLVNGVIEGGAQGLLAQLFGGQEQQQAGQPGPQDVQQEAPQEE